MSFVKQCWKGKKRWNHNAVNAVTPRTRLMKVCFVFVLFHEFISHGSSFPSLSFFVSPPYLIEGIHAEGSKKLINWAENQSDKIRLERRNNGGLKSVLAVQFLFLKPTTKRCRSFLDFSSKAKCTVSCFLQRCLLCDCESSSFVMSFRLIHGILRIHGLCEWNAGICRHPSATHSC